jgi:hypothetical protein
LGWILFALSLPRTGAFRYSLRRLAKTPGFTIFAILAVSLGIGPNTAIFSLVNALLFQPLPYADPERLVVLREDCRGPEWSGENRRGELFHSWNTQPHV